MKHYGLLRLVLVGLRGILSIINTDGWNAAVMWLWIRAWVQLFIRPFRHSTTGQKVKLSFTGSDGSLLGIKSDGKLTLWNPRLGGKPDPECCKYV